MHCPSPALSPDELAHVRRLALEDLAVSAGDLAKVAADASHHPHPAAGAAEAEDIYHRLLVAPVRILDTIGWTAHPTLQARPSEPPTA